MAHARRVIKSWRIEFNTERLHRSLGDLMPAQFAKNGVTRMHEAMSLTADAHSSRY
jgi:transposase InsO family protein